MADLGDAGPARLDASVVICAYTEDRWNDLIAAIDSVRRQSLAPREIIVVIDHNQHLLARVQALADATGITVVENTQTRGLGGARNSGLEVAKGAVIAFLDDDAIAAPDWLEQFAAAFANPEVVGVGGAAEPLWQGGLPRWFPAEFGWVVGCSYQGLPQAPAPVRNLMGCNMAFRREVFDAIGTFRLGYGCDETEFCIRLRRHRAHAQLIYTPRARVFHRVPAARGTWRYFRSRCFFEGGSKAVVTALWGTQDGLASERAHTLRTLPRGVLLGLADAALRRDHGGLARAGAICAGLAITAAGYVVGKISVAQAARRRGWAGQVRVQSA